MADQTLSKVAAAILHAAALAEGEMDLIRKWVRGRDMSPVEVVLQNRGGDPQALSSLTGFKHWSPTRQKVAWSELIETFGPLTSDRRDQPTISPYRPLTQGQLVVASQESPFQLFYVTQDGDVLIDRELAVKFPSRRGWLRGELRAVSPLNAHPEDVDRRGVTLHWQSPDRRSVLEDQPLAADALLAGHVAVDLDTHVVPGRHVVSLLRRQQQLARVVFTVELGSGEPAWLSY